jgi:hypothetical protein
MGKTFVVLLLLAGCGSATPQPSVNPSPTALMTLDDCATYCRCATPQPTVPVTGVGMCICAQPTDGGNLPGSEAYCACGGWAQAADAGTGPDGAPWDALLWLPTAECSAFNSG